MSLGHSNSLPAYQTSKVSRWGALPPIDMEPDRGGGLEDRFSFKETPCQVHVSWCVGNKNQNPPRPFPGARNLALLSRSGQAPADSKAGRCARKQPWFQDLLLGFAEKNGRKKKKQMHENKNQGGVLKLILAHTPRRHGSMCSLSRQSKAACFNVFPVGISGPFTGLFLGPPLWESMENMGGRVGEVGQRSDQNRWFRPMGQSGWRVGHSVRTGTELTKHG